MDKIRQPVRRKVGNKIVNVFIVYGYPYTVRAAVYYFIVRIVRVFGNKFRRILSVVEFKAVNFIALVL